MSSSKTIETIPLSQTSQWQMIRRRFVKHRLGVAAMFVLIALYTMAGFAEFFAPYDARHHNLDYAYAPPQSLDFNLKDGIHTERIEKIIDPVTFRKDYYADPDKPVPVGFFVRGESYRLWGLIPGDIHFLGVNETKWEKEHPGVSMPPFYLFGADKYGRDIFSRIIYGARISLSIGIISIVVTFVLGILIGGISGYVGGRVDNFIMRFIEVAGSFPRLPLWLALGVAMPPDWSSLKVYFCISILLSLLGWMGLARVVRGKILSLREEDYAVAARLLGASHGRIIFRHLLPGFTSHIIVVLTLSVPGMILGETGMSFLGLGIRPPIVSWGVMLQDCMNMQVVINYPWLLLPVLFLVLTVLCFNFLGDGLRDAADPYSSH